jgi:chemotaxis protein MotB
MHCLPFRPLVALVLLAALATSGCSSRAALDEGPSEIELLREDLNAAYAEIDRLKTQNASMERQLREAMDRAVGGASNGERGETVAVLPTDILFASGSAELTPEGVAALADVAARLRAEFPGREVRIEGSTDDKPIGPNLQSTYPSNWELSAARASMVARHLQWTHNLEGTNMEVVGLAQYHPLASNATPEGRQQNRRVRIAVMGE